jgi:hypothetical protein
VHVHLAQLAFRIRLVATEYPDVLDPVTAPGLYREVVFLHGF